MKRNRRDKTFRFDLGSAIGSQLGSEPRSSESSNLSPRTKEGNMSNNLFNISYNHIGNRDDVHDWVYSHVMQTLFDRGLSIFRFTIDGVLKDGNPDDFIKTLLDLSKTKLRFVGTGNRRSYLSYLGANEDITSYLHVELQKKEKEDNLSIWFVSGNKDLVSEVEDFCKQNLVKKKENTVYVIAQGAGGLTLNSLGPIESVLERGNYDDHVLEGYDYLIGELNKKDPYGRLSIVNGPPGTGKTYLVRSLISSIKDCLVVLLPAKLVSEIDSPQLITMLAEEKAEFGRFTDETGGAASKMPILFVVEDADACLAPRQSDNVMSISSLLNYTDGILGSMLDLRVIATTNQPHVEFDEALTREGRLCRHILVDLLSPERATEVYKRLSGRDDRKYTKPTSLSKVYAQALGKENDFRKDKKSLGFGS
jgi:hypothetical protein